MKLIPTKEVMDISAGTGGLIHVSAFLAQALDQGFGICAPEANAAPVVAVPLTRGLHRADIAKCHGDHLDACDSCMRRLAADAGPEQQWAAPAIKDGACALYANQERYGTLYKQAQ